MHKIILGELFFWLHTIILIVILAAGLFMAWWWVVLVLVIVRVQQVIFHGCILTLLEVREGGIKRGMAYYQLATRRFFGSRLSKRGVYIVSFSHNVVTISVVIFANLYNIRFHL